MTKYGFRDNSAVLKDITIKNDLTIEGDMSFGDASTDTLTVTGDATFSGTVGVTGAFTGTSGAFSTTLGVTGLATLSGALNVTGDVGFGSRLLLTDSAVGGAANGSIIKKQLIAGEAYTTTTAGLMVKNYGEATATVPSGEFTGLYVSVKGLHTDPGHNTSIISAHVHASDTTVVWAVLWLYGDMINGI